MLELVEGDFDAFFAAPFHCYGRDGRYVSPMQSDLRRLLSAPRNPLFREHGAGTFFTVRQGGRAVGRVVAHVHRASNRLYGLKRSYFGFFDCADDPEVAGRLLGAAEDWGRRQGCDEIAGNFNLTAMQQLGVVTEGFEHAPYTDMVYNPPHVPKQLESCGYTPFFPVSTHEIDLTSLDPSRLLGPKQRALLRSVELRWVPLRRRGFHRVLEDARAVLNDGFAENPMFVPLTPEEFQFQAGEMMWIVDARISVLAYRGDEPMGVVVCIPDLNPFLRSTGSRLGLLTPWHFVRHRLGRTRAVIIFYSVRRSFHNRGLNGAMLFKVTSALKAAGYTRLGVTWIADVNRESLRQMEKLGARRLHRLHLFRKRLAP